MAPTSDERCAVAARMREIMRQYPDCLIDGMIAQSILDVIGEGVPIGETVASLIDPTCQNKQIVYNMTAPIEFRTDNFTCSACGETFCADGDGVNYPIDWAFCPNCGARVTETEE